MYPHASRAQTKRPQVSDLGSVGLGELRYTQSAGFDAFLENLMSEDLAEVLIDLSETKYIDSTNLGLIARIGEKTLTSHNRKTTLLSPNIEINQILLSVGFDMIFTIIQDGDKYETEYNAVPESDKDDVEMARMMINAHKTLMELNEKNKMVFKDVVDMMENEMEENQ